MQQKIKNSIRYTAVAALVVVSLYYLPLLYFGCAGFKTTILVYTLLCIALITLINILNNQLGFAINPNVKILIVTTALCLLGGEYALRFVFKNHLTYSERNGKSYVSSYSYIHDWRTIIQYITGSKNYWYLTNNPNSEWTVTTDDRVFTHRQNSLGFREEEKQPLPDDPQHLVIGIGDSFAEGVGATADSTWLRMMADNLNTDTACHIRTYNAGVSGSDVYFEYMVLQQLLQKYHPNTVVLGINTSDIDDIILKGGRNRFKPGGRLRYNNPPWWEGLYAVSYIFRAVLHSGKNHDWTLLTFDEEAVQAKQAVDSIETTVYRFNTLVKQNGARLVVVLHPREDEVVSGSFPYDTLAAKLAADTTMYTINMQQQFAASGLLTKQTAHNYYWKTDLHHNAGGYRVMGTLIAGYLRSKGLLCKPAQ